MKITITTPSVRKDMLAIVNKCLKRQTFTDWEWLVGSPEDYGFGTWVPDPPKKEGDYYCLNASWNAMFRKAQGELIVSIQDGLWFEPTLLENLWEHYEANPLAVIGITGNQYDQLVNGKPEHMVWQDPRQRTDMGSLYETISTEIEWSIVSFPKKAIYDVGGVPEDYDRGAALSEKITNLRFDRAGYKLYLDQGTTYRAIHHPRLSADWDEKYLIAVKLYQADALEILEGRKLKLNYL